MKIFKTVLLIIWAILTIGLVIYGHTMRKEAEMNKAAVDESINVMAEMSKAHLEYYNNMVLLRNDSLHLVDIDSLFESSFFLTKYEEKMNSKED